MPLWRRSGCPPPWCGCLLRKAPDQLHRRPAMVQTVLCGPWLPSPGARRPRRPGPMAVIELAQVAEGTPGFSHHFIRSARRTCGRLRHLARHGAVGGNVRHASHPRCRTGWATRQSRAHRNGGDAGRHRGRWRLAGRGQGEHPGAVRMSRRVGTSGRRMAAVTGQGSNHRGRRPGGPLPSGSVPVPVGPGACCQRAGQAITGGSGGSARHGGASTGCRHSCVEPPSSGGAVGGDL